ncbi:MAG: hypothetical protein JW925_10140 [Syntrophaceae bacterium]|nr:hypothetical protein [Syntrophaceae bacterium]
MKSEAGAPFLQSFPSYFTRQSLVRASLDIGRVLADRDGVTFTAQGTCMYPTVRPGDVLTIRPRPAADVSVGDIAVCRTPDYLFSHRVIGRGKEEGRAYIVTRPDRSRHGNDKPTFDDNLLGVVVAIKRKGRPVPLVPMSYPRFIRYYYDKCLNIIEAKERWKSRLAELLSRTDISVFYRPVVKMWFAFAHPRLTYKVQVPLNNTLGNSVFHRIEPEAFNPEEAINGRKIMNWTILVNLNNGQNPAAWITFARDETDAWHVAEAHVRMRYRGAGLDKMLTAQVKKILMGKNQ